MSQRFSITVAAMAVGLAALPRAPGAEGLWEPPAPPEQARAEAEYRRHMARGDRRAIEAAEIKQSRLARRSRRPRAYRALVREAVAAYERAARARPEAAEPHYRAAEVINEHVLDSRKNSPVIRERDLAERALEHWRAFEARAPLDPRGTAMLFRRAIVYTKLADQESLERAIDDYETLLERSDLAAGSTENVATWLGNLAETYMMVGRLDDAIATYRRALEYSNQALYGYGLAVALDRDEQGELARQVMRVYTYGDELRSLHRDGIFFVPEGERHYYLALGYEAMGDLATAVEHYRQFVASGAHPRYQPRAKDNLARAKARMAEQRTSGRPEGPSP